MKPKRWNKQGLAIPTVVSLILLAIFLFFAIKIFAQLGSEEVQLGAKEYLCQGTIALQKTFKLIEPVCSTPLLDVDKKTFEKTQKESDTLEQGGMRYFLEHMMHCKALAGTEDRFPLFSEKECYICYAMTTKEDTPTLTRQQFNEFSLTATRRTGNTYWYDLQTPGNADYPHLFIITDDITNNNRYAIVYADNQAPRTLLVIVGKSAGACILGAKIGALTANPLLTLSGCVIGGAAGTLSSLYDTFHNNYNQVYLTPLKNLQEGGILQCGGYTY